MNEMEHSAVEFYKNGYSCSESIIRASYACEYLDSTIDIEVLNQIASSFSAGMGESGCLCGAVSGAQMVLGANFGRKNSETNAQSIKSISKAFIEKFKEKRTVTCCRVLTKGMDFHSPERKSHCVSIVKEVAGLLDRAIIHNSSASSLGD